MHRVLLYVLLLFIEENLSFTRHLMSEDYCAFKAAQRSCGGRERRERSIENERGKEVLLLSGWTVHGTVKPL